MQRTLVAEVLEEKRAANDGLAVAEYERRLREIDEALAVEEEA